MSILGSLLKGGIGAALAPFTGGASLAPLIGGAALGAAKHQFVDKPAEDRSRHLAAETIRNSPWTGMQAGPIQQAPGLFKSALQGAGAGAAMSKAAAQQPQPAPTPTAGDIWKSMPLQQKPMDPIELYKQKMGAASTGQMTA